MSRIRERLAYAAVWLACFSPALWIVYLGVSGGLGANPIEKLIRTLGNDGLYLLIATLAITPAAQLLRQPRLIRYRRTVGLFAFAYVCLHLLAYVGLDQFFDWRAIGADIVRRPYITVGMTAFVLLIPLAVTSTDGMIRRMGPRAWRRLHQLIYLIVPLGVLHYYMLVKADTRPPLVFGLIVALLLAYRVVDRIRRSRARAGRRSSVAAPPCRS